MAQSMNERRQLAGEFPGHIERMQRCMRAAGHVVTDDRLVRAWTEYSDSLCAVWLDLPEPDEALLDLLLKYLPPLATVAMVAVGDDSGDLWLPLPDVARQAGWCEGDAVEVTIGSDALVLRRVDGANHG